MTQGRKKGEAVADHERDEGVVDHKTKIDAGIIEGADQGRETGQGIETVEAAEITEMTEGGMSFL